MWVVKYRGADRTFQDGSPGRDGLCGAYSYYADANDAAEHCLFVEKVVAWCDGNTGYHDCIGKPWKRADTLTKDTNGRFARLDMVNGTYGRK